MILADKGSPGISEGLKDTDAVLVMPPFLCGNGQFSEQEVWDTYNIAQMRIHVERMIQRIKIYNILKMTVPLTNSIDELCVPYVLTLRTCSLQSSSHTTELHTQAILLSIGFQTAFLGTPGFFSAPSEVLCALQHPRSSLPLSKIVFTTSTISADPSHPLMHQLCTKHSLVCAVLLYGHNQGIYQIGSLKFPDYVNQISQLLQLKGYISGDII